MDRNRRRPQTGRRKMDGHRPRPSRNDRLLHECVQRHVGGDFGLPRAVNPNSVELKAADMWNELVIPNPPCVWTFRKWRYSAQSRGARPPSGVPSRASRGGLERMRPLAGSNKPSRARGAPDDTRGGRAPRDHFATEPQLLMNHSQEAIVLCSILSVAALDGLWFNPAFSPDDSNDPEIDIQRHLAADMLPALVFLGDKDT